MKYDTIIIGGGASGLCTAILSKTENNSILIIDHADRVGKKILSTGNGKCNLTNRFCKVDLFDSNPEGIYPYYPEQNRSFAESVIGQFDSDQTISFFESLGMLLEDKNGYIYPRSEQASSVLDMLRFRCEDLGIDMVTNYQPMKITRKKGLFHVDDEYSCHNLVLATGGMSVPKTGSDGSGYEYAKAFGHSIVEPIPCLCALRCSDPFFKELAGVRNDSKVTLLDEEKNPLMEVTGNLQFNDYGVSGIPVFQISSLAGRLLKEGKQLFLRIDLLPEFSMQELGEFLDQKKDHMLLGILNKKLAMVVEKEARNKKDHDDVTPGNLRAMIIKKFKVHPVSLNPFTESQVTAGGVSVDEISPDTCASKLVVNLYFAGEIIDINGICGGYNLQWAWATAHAVAKAIKAQL